MKKTITNLILIILTTLMIGCGENNPACPEEVSNVEVSYTVDPYTSTFDLLTFTLQGEVHEDFQLSYTPEIVEFSELLWFMDPTRPYEVHIWVGENYVAEYDGFDVVAYEGLLTFREVDNNYLDVTVRLVIQDGYSVEDNIEVIQ